MRNNIEETKAFKALDKIAQNMLNKRANRLQIDDAIIQCKTIGLEKWKAISGLPNKWKKIVEEIHLKNEEILIN